LRRIERLHSLIIRDILRSRSRYHQEWQFFAANKADHQSTTCNHKYDPEVEAGNAWIMILVVGIDIKVS